MCLVHIQRSYKALINQIVDDMTDGDSVYLGLDGGVIAQMPKEVKLKTAGEWY